MSKRGQKQLSNRILIIGALIFVLGSGPLLVTILIAKLGFTDDPNPNPVLFGIMAMFTFWPSIILIIIGLIVKFRSRNE